MPLQTITRKTVTIQGYQLTAASGDGGAGNMVASANYLRTRGYTANMSMDSTGAWTLWIQAANSNASYSGKVNDIVVIENDAIASIVTPAQYTQLYNPPA